MDRQFSFSVERWPNGNIKCAKGFDINGLLHQDVEAAVFCYHENGKIQRKEWYWHGNYHNSSGPAVVYYDENGKAWSEHYYIDGEYYSLKSDWERKLAELYASRVSERSVTKPVNPPQLTIEVKVNGNAAQLTDDQYAKICLILSSRS